MKAASPVSGYAARVDPRKELITYRLYRPLSWNSALSIALQYGRSLYDCLYVALAVRSNAELVNADEKLANALASRFPVKWLGAI